MDLVSFGVGCVVGGALYFGAERTAKRFRRTDGVARPEFPGERYRGEVYPTTEQVQAWGLRYLASVPPQDQAQVADAILRGYLLAMNQHFWPIWTGEFGAVRRNAYSVIRTVTAVLLPVLGGHTVRVQFPDGHEPFLQKVNHLENAFLQLQKHPGNPNGVFTVVEPEGTSVPTSGPL